MGRTPVQRSPADSGASLGLFEGTHRAGRGLQGLPSREKQKIVIHCKFPILYYFHYLVLICSTCGAEERCVQSFGRKICRKGTT